MQDELDKLIDAQNISGHASDHFVPNDHDQDNADYQEWKAIKEYTVAKEFENAYSGQFRKEITEIEHNSADPPDCFALLDGKKIGIEVTELVKSEIRKLIARAWNDLLKKLKKVLLQELSKEEKFEQQKKNYKDNYKKSEWNKDELLNKLQKRITKKNKIKKLKKCAKKMRVILVIYTDEPGLSDDRLKIWLSGNSFSSRYLKEIFLLGPYRASNNAQLKLANSSESTTGSYPLYRVSVE